MGNERGDEGWGGVDDDDNDNNDDEGGWGNGYRGTRAFNYDEKGIDFRF